MNLNKKKELAKRTFGVGKDRIVFVASRVADIKEAITKQDMRDLLSQGAIMIKNVKGRRKVVKSKSRSVGNARKRVDKEKRNYIILTRKLRIHVSDAKKGGKVSKEHFDGLRKKIKNREFRSKAHLNEHLQEMKK